MSGNVRITEEPAFRNYWYPVADAASLGDGPMARRLLGQDIVVWRTSTGVTSAAADRCPHRAARLSCGWIDNDALVCPYHGWEYGTDGRARHIPQLAEDVPIPPRCWRVTSAWSTGTGSGCASANRCCRCPKSPKWALPAGAPFPSPRASGVARPCSWWTTTSIRPTFAFVHRNTFGSPARARVPVPVVVPTDSGFKMTNDFYVQSRPGEVGETMRHTELELYGPFIILLKTTYPDGLVNFMLKGVTPEDDNVTRQIQQILRSDSEADRPGKEIVAFDEEVWREDKAVLEPAWPVFDPGPAGALHLRTDRASIEYRKMVRQIIEGVSA